MYAIIKTGGKQYRVSEGDVIDVELLNGKDTDQVTFNEVVMLNSGNAVKVGTPFLAGATVQGEVVAEAKGKKLIIFKYKKRKRNKVKNGHRQKYSRVKITGIKGE